MPTKQGIHAVIGSIGPSSWACGVFATRRSALAYLRMAPRRKRSELFVLSMPDLELPIYIIQSPCGLLFARWSKAQRYVKPGVTIFQAIYSFRSDKPHIDDMRQLLGLADIDSSNFKEVPDLMRRWKEQEEGWAWLDRNLDKEQRRRLEARKRKAIRIGLQRMREGKVFTREEAEAALDGRVDQEAQDAEQLTVVAENLADIESGDPGVPHEVAMKRAPRKIQTRFSKRRGET